MDHIILCMKYNLCMNIEFCSLVIFNFEPCSIGNEADHDDFKGMVLGN